VAEGPFTVLRVSKNNPLVVTLDLPSSMQIHPMFYASLLRPTATNPLPGQITLLPDPVVIDEEPKYLVKQILDVTMDKRYRPPRFTYLVKWVGYDQTSPKPPKHLDHC
jgi:hypothetical protein